MWKYENLQVNLFQKPSFLHQLTHNMTEIVHWIPRKIQVHNMLCTKILFLFWHSIQYLYTRCSELVFFGEFNEQCLVILWVNWFKNESFWKRFTCTSPNYCKKVFSWFLNDLIQPLTLEADWFISSLFSWPHSFISARYR